MNFGPEALDLVVLAADKHIAVSVDVLIRRRRADLGIRAVSFDVRRHPESDPGCRTRAAEFLRPLIRRYRYALVVFDHEGCSSKAAPGEIRREIESALGRNGWKGRSKAIVIVPELEAWVWIPSGKVARTLGWSRGFEPLREWLEEKSSGPLEVQSLTIRRKPWNRCSAGTGRCPRRPCSRRWRLPSTSTTAATPPSTNSGRPSEAGFRRMQSRDREEPARSPSVRSVMDAKHAPEPA